MRRVLVDHARARGYRKRGGGAQRVTLDEGLVASPDPGLDVLALDRALEVLAKVDPRKSRTVELRFFGGLSVEETAEVIHVSPDTVRRDWRLAKPRASVSRRNASFTTAVVCKVWPRRSRRM
jgi:RNA polymerase sigma-70 factor (ECF subfamily)